MAIDKPMVVIVGFIIVIVILAIQMQYGYMLAIVTLLGGYLIPSPLNTTPQPVIVDESKVD